MKENRMTITNVLIPAAGGVGLALAFKVFKEILAKPDGDEKVQAIAAQIREGAGTFLRQESYYLGIYSAVLFFLLLISLGFSTALAFLLGAACSLSASFIGMRAATQSNSRTAAAAARSNPREALMIAFDGGAVMGLAVASLGLLGLGAIVLIYGFTDALVGPMVGYGVGATSVALFARIGGGIYTKAADVGADLVGKYEAGIPEDDPRNPGVIADNVGDNVGDVAGMGADIFESYVNSIVACATIAITLPVTMLGELTNKDLTVDGAIAATRWGFAVMPFLLAIIGMAASWYGMIIVKKESDSDPTSVLQKATLLSTAIFLAGALVAFFLIPGVKITFWACTFFGAACGLAIGLIAKYYTSSKPVYEIANASKTGPATNLISGLAVGFRSVVSPMWVIAIAVLIASYIGGVYGVGLAAVGMLATTCIVMTIDAYGPIADNAGGIAEMANLGAETRAITDKLDAAGNTTAAIGKGFAVCSAALTAISLFGAFAETITLGKSTSVSNELFTITNPDIMIGALIGGSLSGIVACLTMSAVGRAAGKMVDEIRRQFREIPGLLEGREDAKPDVQRCVSISTDAALSEMMLPGMLAITGPVVTGFLIGPAALGGLLLGTTLTAVVLALFMANAGGAWDNAKKFIEQGLIPGEKKGSDAHRAAVVGDTVGDPFKDTSGPSLNILIKLVSMVALLIAPLLAL
jgi:K(+)-stimulated pyrophosphate-energized sodium pump